MNNRVIIGLLVVVFSGLLLCCGYFLPGPEKIIALEGYNHAHAFCNFKIMITKDVHILKDEHISYVIEEGHMHDPEILDLMELAEEKCKVEE